jgi:hypothetical protein
MEQYNFDQNNLPQPNTLTFGILSLVFCGILGIIFGAIGRKKGKEFIAQGGELAGSSKVGFILSKVGLILGIIATIVIAIYLIVIIAGVASGALK